MTIIDQDTKDFWDALIEEMDAADEADVIAAARTQEET